MSEWATRPLGDLLELVIDHRGKTPNKMGFDDFHSSGYPVLSAKHVKTDELVNLDSMRFANEQMYKKWMKVETQEGDVVLTSEAPMGEVFYLDGKIKYVLGQRVFGLRPNAELIDPLYLAAWLTSRTGQGQLVARASGSTVLGIKQSELLKIEVELPPIEVQAQIAKHRYDLSKKIELNRQINRTLEEMAQAIFKSWFVDFEPVKAKMEASENGEDPERAAMRAISTKTDDELNALPREQLDQLAATAALFPSALQDSPLGPIPEGWGVKKIEDIITRLKPKKRYTKKQVEPFGNVPVLEQGADILLGFHNEEPGFDSSPESPLFVFGDHTCITYLSCEPFDVSQNVIPLAGNSYPTVWVYYAVQGKQEFQEYRRHWSELIIKEVVAPDNELPQEFARIVTTLCEQKECLNAENKLLKQARDALLPKLLSGEISVGAAEQELEEVI